MKTNISIDKKASITIDKEPLGKYRVHRCPPGGEAAIHRNYGLRIIAKRRNQRLRPTDTATGFRYYEFYSISHHIDGEAVFQLEGEEKIRYRQGQGVLMPPHVKHYYGPEKSVFIEDAICFKGIIADLMLNSGIIKPGIINIGRQRRLLPIMEMADDPSHNSQIMANFALQKLLNDLYFENIRIKRDNYADAISDIVGMIQAEPERWWTISELAETCRLQSDQFRNIFRRETGWAPKAYIDKVKIGRAAEELLSSNISVADIARKFGYRDPYHFSRRFKQIIGQAPDLYRKFKPFLK